MHRKICFTLFFLLIFPVLTHAQSDDFIELNFDSPIGNVTWSPTGSKLAFATGLTVHIYDLIGQNLQTIHLNNQDEPIRISQLIWSESEQYIAVLSRPDQYSGLTVFVDVHIYSVEDGSLFLDLGEALEENQYISGSINHVDFSSDDQRLSILSSQYTGGHAYESNIYLVDLDTREIQPLTRFGRMGSSAIRTVWSPSGNILAVDFVSSIEMWDTTTLEQVNSIRTGRTSTTAIHWEDEHTLMTIGREVQRWNTQTGELLSSLPLLNTEISEARIAIDYDPSTNRVQFHYHGTEGRIEVFDGQTGRMSHLLMTGDLGDEYTYRVFNAGGTAYAEGNGEDMTITAVEMPAVMPAEPDFAMQYLETEPISDELVLNANWYSDNTLIAQSEHGVMNLSDSQPRWRMFQPIGDVQVMDNAYSVSGRFQAVSLHDPDSRIMNIQLWDLFEQTQLFEFEGHLGNRAHFTFSADENLLAVATPDMFIRVWNTQTGELQHSLFGLGQLDFIAGFSPYTSLAFSPNNQYLGAVGDHWAHIWDMESDDYRRYSAFTEYVIPPYATTYIIFGEDSTSFTFRTITFEGFYFETTTDESDYPNLATFNDFSEQYPTRWGNRIFDVQFSHDGSVLATTNRWGNIELFETSSREPIPLPVTWCTDTNRLPYPIDTGTANWMTFSPDITRFAFVMTALCIPEVLWDMRTDIEEIAQRNTIWVIDAQTGEFQHLLEDINVWIRSIAFSPDGTMLLAELDDQSFALWETETFQRIR